MSDHSSINEAKRPTANETQIVNDDVENELSKANSPDQSNSYAQSTSMHQSIEIADLNPLTEQKTAEATSTANTKSQLKSSDLSLIADVPVELSVILGSTTLSIQSLFELGVDSVLKLDQNSAAPLDIMLKDRIVARGILVIADDNYGIQITEVMNDDLE